MSLIWSYQDLLRINTACWNMKHLYCALQFTMYNRLLTKYNYWKLKIHQSSQTRPATTMRHRQRENTDSKDLWFEIYECIRGAVGEIWLQPSNRCVIAESDSDAISTARAVLAGYRPKRSALPPDATVKRSRTCIIDDLTATHCHLGKPTCTLVTATTDDSAATMTLTSRDVTRPAVWTNVIAIARITRVIHAVMIHLQHTASMNECDTNHLMRYISYLLHRMSTVQQPIHTQDG